MPVRPPRAPRAAAPSGAAWGGAPAVQGALLLGRPQCGPSRMGCCPGRGVPSVRTYVRTRWARVSPHARVSQLPKRRTARTATSDAQERRRQQQQQHLAAAQSADLISMWLGWETNAHTTRPIRHVQSVCKMQKKNTKIPNKQNKQKHTNAEIKPRAADDERERAKEKEIRKKID